MHFGGAKSGKTGLLTHSGDFTGDEMDRVKGTRESPAESDSQFGAKCTPTVLTPLLKHFEEQMLNFKKKHSLALWKDPSWEDRVTRDITNSAWKPGSKDCPGMGWWERRVLGGHIHNENKVAVLNDAGIGELLGVLFLGPFCLDLEQELDGDSSLRWKSV